MGYSPLAVTVGRKVIITILEKLLQSNHHHPLGPGNGIIYPIDRYHLHSFTLLTTCSLSPALAPLQPLSRSRLSPAWDRCVPQPQEVVAYDLLHKEQGFLAFRPGG